MHEMLLMLAQLMPEEEIVKDLQTASLQYFTGNKEEATRKLHLTCVLFATKFAVKDKDVFEMAKNIEETKRIMERLSSAKS